jgi:hypothetical protein
MILSERERRMLVEIERQLTATDPQLARTMRLGTRSTTAWSRRACDSVTAIAWLSALLCAALFLIGPAVVAALIVTASHHLRTPRPSRTRHVPDRSR